MARLKITFGSGNETEEKIVRSFPKGFTKEVIVPYSWGYLKKNGKRVARYKYL